MKTPITAFILFAFLFTSAYSYGGISYIEKVSPGIKKITNYTTHYVNGKQEGKRVKSRLAIYNKQGAITSLSNAYNGELTIYKNDANGNCIEYVTYDENNNIKNRFLATYDGLNKIIHEIYYKSDNSVAFNFTYNYSSGRKVSRVNTHGTESDTTYYIYDSLGMVVRDSSRYVTNTCYYKYDACGNKTMVNEGMGSIEYNVYKYSSGCTLSERTQTNSDTSYIVKVVYKYDSKGNRLSDIISEKFPDDTRIFLTKEEYIYSK